MLHDLRYAFRALLKRPSFAAGTVLVLSLAVGVNTAVFSLVNALLLRPLPVPDPDGLAFVYHSNERYSVASPPIARCAKRLIPAMAARAATRRDPSGVDVIPIQANPSPRAISNCRVAPAIGRMLQPTDDRPAASPVAIISDGLWKAHERDPGHLGRTLRIDAGAGWHPIHGATTPRRRHAALPTGTATRGSRRIGCRSSNASTTAQHSAIARGSTITRSSTAG